MGESVGVVMSWFKDEPKEATLEKQVGIQLDAMEETDDCIEPHSFTCWTGGFVTRSTGKITQYRKCLECNLIERRTS